MRRHDDTPRLAAPVREDRDHILGELEAPVSLLEYGDFECSFCARAHLAVQEVLGQLGDDVCFIYRHFPVATRHPRATSAALASECAAQQGAFWPMHDLLFARQDALEDEDLIRYAVELNLDAGRFQRELAEGTYEDRVREDFMSGVRSGVNGTPSIFIDGRRHDEGWDAPTLIRTLRAHIARRRKRSA